MQFQEMLVLAAEVGGTQCCNQAGKIYPVHGKQRNCIMLELYLFGLFLGDKILD